MFSAVVCLFTPPPTPNPTPLPPKKKKEKKKKKKKEMRLAYQFAGVANQRAGSLGEKDPSVDSRRRSDCTDPLLGR